MRLIIRIIVTIVILFSDVLQAGTPILFGGLYSDNMNDGNIKMGVGYAYYSQSYNKAKEDNSGFIGESVQRFIYVDGEVGKHGNKVTLGYGETVCCAANVRGGLSYAELEDNKYIGFEAIVSPLFAILKAGVYRDMDDGKYKYLLGVGFGW